MRHDPIRSLEVRADAQAFPPIDPPRPADGPAAAEAPNDPSFASAAEEDAFWSGVATGARMIGRDLPAIPARGEGAPIVPRTADESFADAAEIRAGGRPESGRIRRHDGWTPARMIHFLEVLAATGCVADACKAVGMSVSAAYALRDRREGRAWAVAWQAVLRERARNRLSDENLGRAMNGCVDQIVKDGIVVAERRRYDNRLSMAVLTRLDRQAERTDSEETQLLRAVSEDIEDFYDVIEAGGDQDAFIEARRPKPPPPPEPAAHRFVELDRDLDPVEWVARMVDMDPLSEADPEEIPIDDLDPARRERWDCEGWIRAERSNYRRWLDVMARLGRVPEPERCAAAFEDVRSWFSEAVEDLDADEDQDEEALLDRLAEIVGGELEADPDPAEAVSCEPSTSSTSSDEERPG
ncbi:MAG TPA: hypothetical protein VF702_00790 [Allosphingosinicella sp.]|jgi:hypothetical protein